MVRILAMAALAAAGVACATGNGLRIEQTLPASIDPARVEVVEIAAGFSGDVLMRGTITTPENGSEDAGSQTRQGELTSTANGPARGEAVVRDGEILVDLEGLPVLTFMALRLNGEQVLYFRTDDDGSADIKLTLSRASSGSSR